MPNKQLVNLKSLGLNMKKVQYVLGMIVCCIIMLISCSKNNNLSSSALLPELVETEKIMYDSPDSALHILQTMPPTTDKLQYATWALYMTQARYKLYINQSDSLINIAYNYFTKHEDCIQYVLALYYKASLCKEKNEIDSAQHYFLKSIEKVDNFNDCQLKYLIYADYGEIFLYKAYPQIALQYFEKAYEYAQLSNNDRYISSALSFLAKANRMLSNTNIAIEYYKKAIDTSRNITNSKILVTCMNELSSLYALKKDYKLALEYALKGLSLKEELFKLKKTQGLSLENSYVVIGNIYKDINNVDSAYFYLNKASNSSNVNTKCLAYRLLYKLYNNSHKYDKMMECSDSVWKYQDLIIKEQRNIEIAELREKYNQERLINENKQIEIDKNIIIRNILIIVITLIVSIAIIIYFYQRKLFRKEVAIRNIEEKAHLAILKIQENENTIRKNQTCIDELVRQIESNKDIQEQLYEQKETLCNIQEQNINLTTENQKLRSNIESYSYILKKKAEEITRFEKLHKEFQSLHEREIFLSQQLIKKTPILNNLKLSPKYLDKVQWEEVITYINIIYDNYSIRLTRLIPSLTESEVQICCLIKMRLSNTEIGDILAISSASVSKKKQRLKEHIVQNYDSFDKNQNLDTWLWQL